MRQTEKTLLEQMRITEFDVERRKELLSFTAEDVSALVNCQPFIESEIDLLVSEFYEVQTNIPDIALLIGDADTLNRLKNAQRRYILDLFGGKYDLEYVNNRLRIGLVHKRIGVEPKLYLSAIHVLRSLIVNSLNRSCPEGNTPSAAAAALDKLFFFDVTLVFETYIRSLVSEIESAKDKLEQYARSLEEKVIERTDQLRIDPLTGTSNRRYLVDTLSRVIRAAQRRSEPVSVVFIDVNGFKKINDLYGHQHGDDVLRTLGKVFLTVSRSEDSCFRYGGDEFCVVLSNITEADAKAKYCSRINELTSERLKNVTLSMGVAQTGPEAYEEPEALIRRADKRMYDEKATQRSDPTFQASRSKTSAPSERLVVRNPAS